MHDPTPLTKSPTLMRKPNTIHSTYMHLKVYYQSETSNIVYICIGLYAAQIAALHGKNCSHSENFSLLCRHLAAVMPLHANVGGSSSAMS